eukprot:Em0004g443a
MWRILSSPASETPDTLSHLEKHIMPLSGLVEMALFSNAAASLFSPAVRDGTKEPSAEQQGHTVVDAATHFTTDQLMTWQFKRPRQNI